MKSVLLIFDNETELNFIQENLKENGFQIFISKDINQGLIEAYYTLPDLIVVNTNNTESEIEFFTKAINTSYSKKSTVLSLIELENYLDIQNKKLFIIKPLRPKLLLSLIRSLMGNEKIDWLSSPH